MDLATDLIILAAVILLLLCNTPFVKEKLRRARLTPEEREIEDIDRKISALKLSRYRERTAMESEVGPGKQGLLRFRYERREKERKAREESLLERQERLLETIKAKQTP